MQAQIQIQNTGRRVTTAQARFGDKPKEVLAVQLPPGEKTLSFDLGDRLDAAKFKALSGVLTAADGPFAKKIKKGELVVTVKGGDAQTPDTKPAGGAKAKG